MAFTKGKSGNRKGRPKGIRDKRTRFRELLEPHAEELVQRAVDLALDGDTTALRLCIERIIPSYRSVEMPVPMSVEGDTLSAKGEAVISEMATGAISPSDAAAVLQALAAQARVKEIEELEQRLEQLEQKAQ